MYQDILPELETPCVLIDLKKAQKNADAMQQLCTKAGVALRPHIKTHKMHRFAQMQLAAGASGITCAKISEAEVMAQGGCDDIFIAYPLVGDFRIRRALALAPRLKRLILAVDSISCAQALNDAAAAAGYVLEVRLEVETGANRTGVRQPLLVETAQAVAAMPHLRLTGIYTFKSLSLGSGEATTDNAASGQEEAQLLAKTAALLREAGVPVEEISGGSSPTGEWVAQSGAVTEIRPGTYIFKDCILWKEGVARLDEIAALVAVTVVSVPCDNYAVIDGGTKVFPTDISLNQPPYYYDGYAKVVDNDDLLLTRVNEEHGMLTSKSGQTNLRVGQKLLLYPGHVCTTINLRNEVYLWDGSTVTRQQVDARGMSV